MRSVVDVTVPPVFAAAVARYADVLVIVSPPRCASTALARVFWEHPRVGYYSHEPFETSYFDGAPLAEAAAKIADPLTLRDVPSLADRAHGEALVIKEMPYQVGEHFPLLAALSTRPLTFMVRDPRKAIASRMVKKQQAGDDPNYPHVETGWDLLASQISHCRDRNIPFSIVDAADFRTHPEQVLPRLCERLGLEYTPDMLTWSVADDVDLDNLEGRHRHLYARVLGSDAIQPVTEPVPPLTWFPATDGWRAHVAHCMDVYEALRRDPARVRVAAG